MDLNKFDEARFEADDNYQDEVRATPMGIAVEVLATSLTLQDVGEFLGIVSPELLPRYFHWVQKNYIELDIDPDEALRLTREALKNNEIGIQRPDAEVPDGEDNRGTS